MSPPKTSINTEHQSTEGEVNPKSLVGKTTTSTHNSSPPSHGKNQETIVKIENLAQEIRRLSSDARPSGKLPLTNERLNAAKDSLEQLHKVTREEIRIQRQKEVIDQCSQHMQLAHRPRSRIYKLIWTTCSSNTSQVSFSPLIRTFQDLARRPRLMLASHQLSSCSRFDEPRRALNLTSIFRI